MTEQGAEEAPFPHSSPDVPDMEEQFHGQVGILDIGPVKKADLGTAAAIAHASCEGEEVQTGIGTCIVCLCPVHGTGIRGFCFQRGKK